ncbi:UNVERIFIED_CONTAM: Eukaryotic translation initiation factor 4G [Sesamum radiatum]|uniref:Eukaryotic translation initiation factor 4G n=1 Tax=Sesamum radiatum TaxID=300843 RepID=A0AAW2KQ95_SESRA
MSQNQSRSERSESTQYRKTGRSNQQAQFPGGVSTKGGGGASSAPSSQASRSFKKYNNNAQGGQSRARSPNVDLDSGTHAVQQQQPTHRVADAPVTSISSYVKLTDTPNQNITGVVPGASLSNVSAAAPTSNVSVASSESGTPATHGKGDASKSFPLQFGSISPGFMKGVQIPARTSSAPPNLDEQKKAQVGSSLLSCCLPGVGKVCLDRHGWKSNDILNYEKKARQNSVRLNQVASIPKPHSLKNDTGIPDQTNTVEAQPVSKSKRDTQVSAGAPVTQTQKPAVHHIPGMPMQLPFHQPQVPVQFGGPNPQIQSQAMSGSSLPLPMQMPLPIANPPMQQPMFISGLQPHPMHSQGIIHQGQNFNFSSQMGHQLPPQLGSMGINMAPQFHQQQVGKYGGSRKTVKITHPETHEELRLDSSPGPRSHLNVPPQSPPIPSFPPNHLMNFYPNSYNAPPIFFPAASSVPMNSTQVPPTSQPPRFYNKVTVKPPIGPYGEKESLPAAYSTSVGKTKSSEVDNSSLSALPESKSRLGTSLSSAPSPGSINGESDVRNTLASASAPIDGSASTLISSADEARNGVLVPDSTKDKHNKPVNRGQQYQESIPTTAGAASEASNLASEGAKEGKTGDTYRSLGMKGVNSRQPEPEIIGRKEQGEDVSSESSKFDKNSLEKPMQPLSLESPQITGKEISNQEVTPSIGGLSEHTEGKAKETLGDKISSSDTSQGVRDGIGTTVAKSVVDQESASVLVPSHPHGASIPENADIGNNGGDLVSLSSTTVKDKVLSDTNVAKSVVPRGKKKKKELYRKAEAAGTISDLYMAYKGPKEQKETVTSADSMEKTSSISMKQASGEVTQENHVSIEKPAVRKLEPDDWEDAAENSPQLETSKNESQGIDGDGNGLKTKRYSRDFLLKFVEQCTDLPEGLEITSDIADVLMISSVNVLRESYLVTEEIVTGQLQVLDQIVVQVAWEMRTNGANSLALLCQGEEICGQMLAIWVTLLAIDLDKEVIMVFLGIHGLIHLSSILGASSLGRCNLCPQGGLQRNNFDAERWQRGTGFQKGLMPSPYIPVPVMHRAEKKYEVGKIADEEEAKQRRKAI